jgi:hypothetical protein
MLTTKAWLYWDTSPNMPIASRTKGIRPRAEVRDMANRRRNADPAINRVYRNATIIHGI